MMSAELPNDNWTTPQAVEDDLREPHLYLRLAENALTVAQSLQNNYLKNTATFITDLRHSLRRPEPLIAVGRSDQLDWQDLQSEVVTFIDGGVGQAQISSRTPLLLRVGSYSVRTGERVLSERERFGYYPIVLGELEGLSKDREDFVDIVRIVAELLGGLSALERHADLRVLMFHGPLLYLISPYAGHTPFTEADIDLFLHQYAMEPSQGRNLKEQFLAEARLDIYPRMTAERADELSERRLFEPLAWLAYLYRRLIAEANNRTPVPIVTGVVERSRHSEFCMDVLLSRVFRQLRINHQTDYFNKLFGRTDLTSEQALLERLGYTDSLLLGMLLRPGEYSEPWVMERTSIGLRRGQMRLPGNGLSSLVNWAVLKPNEPFGFPSVTGCYISVSEATEPIRVETFTALGPDQTEAAAQRAFLYSRLLPGYGFPVGLDIVDKFAHVPAWLTRAYGKLIRNHLSASLHRGDIGDAELRRIIIQAIYLTNRDWLYRPEA